MNNDLSKLSSRDINLKQEEYYKCSKTIYEILNLKRREYNKKIQRSWVNPVKLLSLKNEIEDIQIALDLLEEYSKTLLDEINFKNNADANQRV